MARGQQQGSGGVTIGMFVFAALWLASTVFLVILYTGQEELRQNAERCQGDNRKLISQSERNSLEQFKKASSRGPTVVGLMELARAETARLATGEDKDDPAAVRAKLDEQLRTIRSDRVLSQPDRFADISYHEALSTLYEAYKNEHALRVEAENRVEELGAQADKLTEAAAQQKKDLDQRVKQFAEQFTDLQAERDKFKATKNKELEKLVSDFGQRRKESDADLTKSRQRNSLLDKRTTQLKERVAVLRSQLGGLVISPKKLSIAREPDGKILTAVPGDEFVFINLGRSDKLVLGLRFAVYTAGKEIPLDGKAKAQIEVVSIDPQSAECQIVRTAPNQIILPGDLIANPIYDPDRQIRFLVMGAFDLEHDGSAALDDATTIESLITRWGGTVVGHVDASLDFLVLGSPPRRPKQPRDQSAEAVARYERRKQMYEQYRTTVESAKALSIPVLRQEVFLNFLGYSGRYAQR